MSFDNSRKAVHVENSHVEIYDLVQAAMQAIEVAAPTNLQVQVIEDSTDSPTNLQVEIIA